MALRQVYDDNGTLKSKDIAGSGSANAADTAYDNSNTGLPANVQGAIDKTTGNISSLGTVELTATAAHAHAAGSTFLWIGQLVKATAAIAVGDTIAIGMNVKETDICSVLDEVNTNKVFEASERLYLVALLGRCYGNVCSIDGYIGGIPQDATFPLVVGRIPQEYAPSTDYAFHTFSTGGGDSYNGEIKQMILTSNGDMKLRSLPSLYFCTFNINYIKK